MNKTKIIDLVVVLICATFAVHGAVMGYRMQTAATGMEGMLVRYSNPLAFVIAGAGFVMRLIDLERLKSISSKTVNVGVIVYLFSLFSGMFGA